MRNQSFDRPQGSSTNTVDNEDLKVVFKNIHFTQNYSSIRKCTINTNPSAVCLLFFLAFPLRMRIRCLIRFDRRYFFFVFMHKQMLKMQKPIQRTTHRTHYQNPMVPIRNQ